MSKLLEQAFAEASKLPEPDLDALAALILGELASERRWAKAFADSEDVLSQLADEALAEHRHGADRGQGQQPATALCSMTAPA